VPVYWAYRKVTITGRQAHEDGLKDRSSNSSGFSAERISISASMIPHFGMNVQKKKRTKQLNPKQP